MKHRLDILLKKQAILKLEAQEQRICVAEGIEVWHQRLHLVDKVISLGVLIKRYPAVLLGSLPILLTSFIGQKQQVFSGLMTCLRVAREFTHLMLKKINR
jgi:hypothetical protein